MMSGNSKNESALGKIETLNLVKSAEEELGEEMGMGARVLF